MRRSALLTASVIVMVGALTVAMAASPALGAKKGHHHHHKKKGGGTFTNATPVPIPAASPTEPFTSGKVTSTIVVPKSKKALVDDANVGVRVNVNNPTYTTAGLSLYLVAPSGESKQLLFSFSTGGDGTAGTGLGNGPSTCASGTMLFDDEAHKQGTSPSPPNQTPSDPYEPSTHDSAFDEFVSYPPYAGSVQPQGGSLSGFDGGQDKGTWSLVMINSNFPDTMTLVCWQLQIKPEPTATTTKKKHHHHG
jgi:hypothetical protein